MLFWALAKLVNQGQRGEDHDARSHSPNTTAVYKQIVQVVKHFSMQIEYRLPSLTPQGISNIVWSLGTLRLRDSRLVGPLMKALSARIESRSSGSCMAMRLNSQELSNVIWGLARLSVSIDTICAKALAGAIQKHLKAPASHRVESRHVANLLWGCAHVSSNVITSHKSDWNHAMHLLLKRVPKYTLAGAGGPGREPQHHSAGTTLLNPQELSMSSWAVATFHGELTDQSAEAITQAMIALQSHALTFFFEAGQKKLGQQRSTLSPQQVGTLAWAAGKTRFSIHGLVPRLVDMAANLAPRMSAQDLDQVFWACARLRSGPGQKNADQADEEEMKHHKVTSKSGFVVHDRFVQAAIQRLKRLHNRPTQNLSTIMWSLAKLKLRRAAAELILELGPELASRAGELQSRQLANLAWALATLRLGVDAVDIGKQGKQMEVRKGQLISESVEANMGQISEKGRSRVATATKSVWRAIGKESAQRVPEFNAQEMSKLLWAMSRSGVEHEALCNAASAERTTKYHFPYLCLNNYTKISSRASPSSVIRPSKNNKVGTTISIRDIKGGGRRLAVGAKEATGTTAATGGALWEGSLVLAEWLSRCLSSAEGSASELPPCKLYDSATLWRQLEGGVAVELGAGVGLVSIVASLAMNLHMVLLVAIDRSICF